MTQQRLRLVCTSDLHNQTPTLPEGDVLVIAGDLTREGTTYELRAMGDWIRSQPHAHKIVIAGNHDIELDQGFYPGDAGRRALGGGMHYLENSSVVIGGWKFWGSPLSKCRGWAFFSEEGPQPEPCDVLITHQPPSGIGDCKEYAAEHSGYVGLREWVKEFEPRYHVFGHYHQGRGVYSPFHLNTTFVNAAYCGHKERRPWILNL